MHRTAAGVRIMAISDGGHAVQKNPTPDQAAEAGVLRQLPELIGEGRFADIERQLLASDVRLRALLPSGPETHNGSAGTAHRIREWFDRGQRIRLDECRVESVADRWLLGYRFVAGEGSGQTAVYQQCVCDVEDGRIRAIDLVCSGYRPLPQAEAENTVHHFDAGNLGCADGLAQAFRERISALPVGARLEVVTRDPAAREDLPPMARMLGHTVVSQGPGADGGSVIVVRRGSKQEK